MSITVKDIIDFSKQHSPLGGRRTSLETSNLLISIVGGRQGLYGDFVETFELAIIDPKTGNFITDYFDSNSDQVMGYVKGEDLINIISPLLEKGFRVA